MKKSVIFLFLVTMAVSLAAQDSKTKIDSANSKKFGLFVQELYMKWYKENVRQISDSIEKSKVHIVNAGSVRALGKDTPVIAGSFIYVEVTDIRKLLNLQRLLLQTYPHDTSYRLILYINGLPMYDIPVYTKDLAKNRFIFNLDRKANSLKQLYPFFTLIGSKVRFPFSVGFRNGDSLPLSAFYTGTPMRFVSATALYLTLVLVLFIIFIFIFIYLANRTDLIRVGDNKSRFSLGLIQLCFWTVVVASSYFYIWILTQEVLPVSKQTLILLGISIITTAGSKVIDFQKKTPVPVHIPSRGFLTDISSDDTGSSVHRVQMILWTVILGIIFITRVVKEQKMPELDDSLLALMGISSAGFVGLKIMEKSGGSS